MKLRKIKLLLHKACPAYRRHVLSTWDFQPIRTFWFCRYCFIRSMSSVGRAYRRTLLMRYWTG